MSENHLVILLLFPKQSILLIEEIRFINMSEKLVGLLKLTAFWTRYLLEKRLYREKLQHLSAFASVTVYQPSVARKVLDDTISSHEKHRLPFALLCIKGAMSEADVGKISSGLRIYDDMFMLDKEKILIFLSMTDENNLPLILDRLKAVSPQFVIEVTNKKGY